MASSSVLPGDVELTTYPISALVIEAAAAPSVSSPQRSAARERDLTLVDLGKLSRQLLWRRSQAVQSVAEVQVATYHMTNRRRSELLASAEAAVGTLRVDFAKAAQPLLATPTTGLAVFVEHATAGRDLFMATCALKAAMLLHHDAAMSPLLTVCGKALRAAGLNGAEGDDEDLRVSDAASPAAEGGVSSQRCTIPCQTLVFFVLTLESFVKVAPEDLLAALSHRIEAVASRTQLDARSACLVLKALAGFKLAHDRAFSATVGNLHRVLVTRRRAVGNDKLDEVAKQRAVDASRIGLTHMMMAIEALALRGRPRDGSSHLFHLLRRLVMQHPKTTAFDADVVYKASVALGAQDAYNYASAVALLAVNSREGMIKTSVSEQQAHQLDEQAAELTHAGGLTADYIRLLEDQSVEFMPDEVFSSS